MVRTPKKPGVYKANISEFLLKNRIKPRGVCHHTLYRELNYEPGRRRHSDTPYGIFRSCIVEFKKRQGSRKEGAEVGVDFKILFNHSAH